MALRSGRAWAVMAGMALAACAGEGDADASARGWSPETAPLVFGATRGGVTDLWLHDPVTGTTRTVVATDRIEVAPTPSPDGRRMAYHARGADRPYGLFVAEVGESGEPVRVRALDDDPDVHTIGAVWSPDGREVATFSNRGLRPGEAGAFPGHVYAVDVETGAARRLTRTPLPGTLGPSDWSADGRWILMARPFDGQLDVVRLEVATGAEERLTDGPEDEYSARFSRDGTRIAFHMEAESFGAQVAVQELETGVRRRITREAGWWYGPSWSPDDRWLLVTAAGTDGVDYDLVAVRVEDGAVRRLVETDEDERYGRWVPRSSPWLAGGDGSP